MERLRPMRTVDDLELLAPAGNWECARAAVANGADAIFFGLPAFNARMRADNFTMEELPELMAWLHQRGVRGLVAMNTLIFTGELTAAETQLQLMAAARVDAVIVQDVGLARMVKAIAPGIALHASTQMTIASPESLAAMAPLGLQRAVLSRELSLRELERFRDQPIPTEVFVHGALCVAYSGQCLTSESLGKRSANRGECAQACRMPYDLIVDGVHQDLGDRRYLLSPQDLSAVAEIPDLIALGVTSFKIEGRLKSPEYVAAVTRVYRQAIDAAVAGQPQTTSEQDRYELEMTFSRGLFTGWMHGVDHQQLVGARYGKKRGALAGRIVATGRDWLELDSLGAQLKPGDGIVIDTGGDTNAEQGGFVFEITGRKLAFQHGKIDTRGLQIGDRVWKTSDPALDKRLRSTYAGDPPIRKTQPLHLVATGSPSHPLHLHLVGTPHTVTSEMPLQPAQNRPLTHDSMRDQLSRLGGTGLHLAQLDFQVEGAAILPVSELNRMRRALVAAYTASRALPAVAPPQTTVAHLLGSLPATTVPAATPPELIVLCRSMDQVKTCVTAGIHTIYLDLEDIRGYAAAVSWVRTESTSTLHLATPRIQKSGEQGFFKLIERAAPHGVLVRNPGAVAWFSQREFLVTGDFSLNIANPLSAEWFHQGGVQRMAISCDLDIQQVLDLLAHAPAPWFELILHQHMPLFHMEHCVFAAFMSEGKSFLDCGRPCDRHRVKLRDRTGREHPLMADAGCRNTLYNAVPQTGAGYYDHLHTAGLRHYRLDLLHHTPAEVHTLLTAYQRLLQRAVPGEHLWRELHALSQLGVTRGTLSAE